MKNPSYNKEVGDLTEQLVLNTTSVGQLAGVMIFLYQFMLDSLTVNTPDSINRIYNIILKGTKHLKKLADTEGIASWDGDKTKQEKLAVE